MKSVYANAIDVLRGSHPARGAWIEIDGVESERLGRQSHPARGAWIEINGPVSSTALAEVAPRKGCVD